MPDDLLLRAAKGRQAENGIEDGQRIGSTVAVKGSGSRPENYVVRSAVVRKRS
jgi:hypothetical protein